MLTTDKNCRSYHHRRSLSKKWRSWPPIAVNIKLLSCRRILSHTEWKLVRAQIRLELPQNCHRQCQLKMVIVISGLILIRVKTAGGGGGKFVESWEHPWERRQQAHVWIYCIFYCHLDGINRITPITIRVWAGTKTSRPVGYKSI